MGTYFSQRPGGPGREVPLRTSGRPPITLRLSGTDQERLRTATRTLLSPLEYAAPGEWCVAVEGDLRRLLRADHSLFLLPGREGVMVSSDTAGKILRERLAGFFSGMVTGRMRSDDPQMDRVLALRKAMDLDIHHAAMLRPLIGSRPRRSRFFLEVLRPARVRDHWGMRVPLGVGEADLNVAYTSGAETGLTDGERRALLELLLPAFRAGVKQHLQGRDWPLELGRSFDALDQPFLVVDLDGRELHRTVALVQLLEEDLEGEWVLAATRALARDMGRLRRKSQLSADEVRRPLGERELQTPTGRYQLRGTYVTLGEAGREQVGLVAVERRGLRLPPAETLVRQGDLTPRQAEIALLLARGLSDQTIADALYISPNTVRTHTTHLYRKLNIHSRNALALRLCRVEAEADNAWGTRLPAL